MLKVTLETNIIKDSNGAFLMMQLNFESIRILPQNGMLSFMMCVWECEAGTNSQRVHESLNLEKMGCHSASSTLHQPTQYY